MSTLHRHTEQLRKMVCSHLYSFFMKSILKKKKQHLHQAIESFLSMFVYMGVRVEGNSEMKIHSAMQILFEFKFLYISVPAGLYKPKFFSANSSMIRLTWEEPASLNGPAPLYSVEKTVPSLNYPPLVVQGTRFPGGGYYLFPPDIIPPNVAYTGKYQLGHTSQ